MSKYKVIKTIFGISPNYILELSRDNAIIGPKFSLSAKDLADYLPDYLEKITEVIENKVDKDLARKNIKLLDESIEHWIKDGLLLGIKGQNTDMFGVDCALCKTYHTSNGGHGGCEKCPLGKMGMICGHAASPYTYSPNISQSLAMIRKLQKCKKIEEDRLLD